MRRIGFVLAMIGLTFTTYFATNAQSLSPSDVQQIAEGLVESPFSKSARSGPAPDYLRSTGFRRRRIANFPLRSQQGG